MATDIREYEFFFKWTIREAYFQSFWAIGLEIYGHSKSILFKIFDFPQLLIVAAHYSMYPKKLSQH
jgi:hypothetical protein